jgi:hypothetical protein
MMSSLDPRIIRTDEGRIYLWTRHWKIVECEDPSCAAKVRNGKPQSHRVYDPGAPKSENELVLRLAVCTRVDCLTRRLKPGVIHYHQGPKEDSDMENVVIDNLDPKH